MLEIHYTKAYIESGWRDVEKLEPHTKTGVSSEQIGMCFPVAVFSKCQQLLGKQFQDGRSLQSKKKKKSEKKSVSTYLIRLGQDFRISISDPDTYDQSEVSVYFLCLFIMSSKLF